MCCIHSAILTTRLFANKHKYNIEQSLKNITAVIHTMNKSNKE